MCVFSHWSTFSQTKFRVCARQRQLVYDLCTTTGNSTGGPLYIGRLTSLWLHIKRFNNRSLSINDRHVLLFTCSAQYFYKLLCHSLLNQSLNEYKLILSLQVDLTKLREINVKCINRAKISTKLSLEVTNCYYFNRLTRETQPRTWQSRSYIVH